MPTRGNQSGTRTTVLATESVQAERKLFPVELCENHLGRFVRLTENSGGRIDKIAIPWSGFADVRAMLDRLSAVDTPPAAETDPSNVTQWGNKPKRGKP